MGWCRCIAVVVGVGVILLIAAAVLFELQRKQRLVKWVDECSLLLVLVWASYC